LEVVGRKKKKMSYKILVLVSIWSGFVSASAPSPDDFGSMACSSSSRSDQTSFTQVHDKSEMVVGVAAADAVTMSARIPVQVFDFDSAAASDLITRAELISFRKEIFKLQRTTDTTLNRAIDLIERLADKVKELQIKVADIEKNK
jgi:hypothetical protein